MAESSFVPSINEGTDKYKSVWMTRDEKDNFSQKHDAELIKEEKRKEVEEEIRIQVDELMRAELKNLKAVCKFTLSKDANFQNFIFKLLIIKWLEKLIITESSIAKMILPLKH